MADLDDGPDQTPLPAGQVQETAARLLAMERRLPKPDKFFVAGLLHDVGRLVLLAAIPIVMLLSALMAD